MTTYDAYALYEEYCMDCYCKGIEPMPFHLWYTDGD